MTDDFRCGSIALIGLPNAGKSTLLNSALGQKISIISSKPRAKTNMVFGSDVKGRFHKQFRDITNVPRSQLEREQGAEGYYKWRARRKSQ